MSSKLKQTLSKLLPKGRVKNDAQPTWICNPPLATRTPAPQLAPRDEPPPAYEGLAPQPDCKDPDRCPRTTSAIDCSPPAGPTQLVGQSMASQVQTADDPYNFLRIFDTILLIDDSGSMAGPMWDEAGDALTSIAPICTNYTKISSLADVDVLFKSVRPNYGTPTGQRLHKILTEYLRTFEAEAKTTKTTKPINIICITDGVPTDDVESPLIACTKKLDKLDAPAWQVGVQFFQIGSDEQAQKHLMELDDELRKIAEDDEMRDMVDTVPFQRGGRELTGEGILKVVSGAVTRRLDRSESGAAPLTLRPGIV